MPGVLERLRLLDGRSGPSSPHCPRSRAPSRSSWTATPAGRARAACPCWPATARARARCGDGRGLPRRRRRLAGGVRVLDRELEPARRRGARAARPAGRDDQARVPRHGPHGRARALRRPARPLLALDPAADRGHRARYGGQRGPDPVDLLRLRRPLRARRGGPLARARRRRGRGRQRERAGLAAERSRICPNPTW